MSVVRFYKILKAKIYLPLVIGILISHSAYAVINYFEIPEAELRRLPPFCKNGFERSGIATEGQWLNHLCPGLYALNHAKQIIERNAERKFALKEAVDHFSYTLGHTTEGFFLRYAILVKRGEAYEMLGRTAEAVADYQAAILVNPKKDQAYVALADAYLKSDNSAQALDVIRNGLKMKPKSKKLLRRQAKILGGITGEPESLTK